MAGRKGGGGLVFGVPDTLTVTLGELALCTADGGAVLGFCDTWLLELVLVPLVGRLGFGGAPLEESMLIRCGICTDGMW